VNSESKVVVSPWKRVRRAMVAAAAFYSWMVPALFAQEGVPREILERTIFIKTPNGTGTAFKVDYQGKVYLVTARHLVAGLPIARATIQVRQAEEWKDLHTVRTLFPVSADADIAVFETKERIAEPFRIPMEGETGGVTFGQQVWFLGFPFEGLGTRVGNSMLPFIKRGTMSATDSTNLNAVVFYVDGFNNPGFSGGPILYWDFTGREYRIIGVVKGYREDTAKTIVNGVHVNTQLLVNSGILIGYSIKHAIQAIEHGQNQP
jgi:hypothetical protein